VGGAGGRLRLSPTLALACPCDARLGPTLRPASPGAVHFWHASTTSFAIRLGSGTD
jgi:hypothetical protein